MHWPQSAEPWRLARRRGRSCSRWGWQRPCSCPLQPPAGRRRPTRPTPPSPLSLQKPVSTKLQTASATAAELPAHAAEDRKERKRKKAAKAADLKAGEAAATEAEARGQCCLRQGSCAWRGLAFGLRWGPCAWSVHPQMGRTLCKYPASASPALLPLQGASGTKRRSGARSGARRAASAASRAARGRPQRAARARRGSPSWHSWAQGAGRTGRPGRLLVPCARAPAGRPSGELQMASTCAALCAAGWPRRQAPWRQPWTRAAPRSPARMLPRRPWRQQARRWRSWTLTRWWRSGRLWRRRCSSCARACKKVCGRRSVAGKDCKRGAERSAERRQGSGTSALGWLPALSTSVAEP